jgi:hypothetical protein
MTEAEWLACDDPVLMLEFLRGAESDRKCTLFAVNCSSAAGYWYSDPEWVEVIDQRTDAVLAGTEPLHRLIGLFGAFEFRTPPTAAGWARTVALYGRQPVGQAAILRDILGPLPFRPVALDPACLTSTAVGLAEGVYADRTWDRLPILADALEDAGCTDADVLAHLRGPGPHARGCWPVDLVLGKS